MNPIQSNGMGGPVTTQPTEPSNYFLPPPAVPAPMAKDNIIGPIGGENGFGEFGGRPGAPPPFVPFPSMLLRNSQNPSDLECLASLDRVVIKQQGEILEEFCGCETNNKYLIQDVNNRDLFNAKEMTDCCTRSFCGPFRPFELKMKNASGQEVIRLERPLACKSCLFPCWLQSIEVFAPVGVLIGRVVQQWSLCRPSFKIEDDHGNAVYFIRGPACTWSCFGDVEFCVKDTKGNEVAKIAKNWGGIAREAVTDADNFTVMFAREMDLKMKAVLIGAAFLLDFMYFEKCN